MGKRRDICDEIFLNFKKIIYVNISKCMKGFKIQIPEANYALSFS